MKEMVGHTDCSVVLELEDTVLVVRDQELVLSELCEGATVTKEVDRDLDGDKEGVDVEEVRSVLTDEEVRGVEPPPESPDVPSAVPRGIW